VAGPIGGLAGDSAVAGPVGGLFGDSTVGGPVGGLGADSAVADGGFAADSAAGSCGLPPGGVAGGCALAVNSAVFGRGFHAALIRNCSLSPALVTGAVNSTLVRYEEFSRSGMS